MSSEADLKKDIASFYDSSSNIWEDIWGEHMHHGYYVEGRKPKTIEDHRLVDAKRIGTGTGKKYPCNVMYTLLDKAHMMGHDVIGRNRIPGTSSLEYFDQAINACIKKNITITNTFKGAVHRYDNGDTRTLMPPCTSAVPLVLLQMRPFIRSSLEILFYGNDRIAAVLYELSFTFTVVATETKLIFSCYAGFPCDGSKRPRK